MAWEPNSAGTLCGAGAPQDRCRRPAIGGRHRRPIPPGRALRGPFRSGRHTGLALRREPRTDASSARTGPAPRFAVGTPAAYFSSSSRYGAIALVCARRSRAAVRLAEGCAGVKAWGRGGAPEAASEFPAREVGASVLAVPRRSAPPPITRRRRRRHPDEAHVVSPDRSCPPGSTAWRVWRYRWSIPVAPRPRRLPHARGIPPSRTLYEDSDSSGDHSRCGGASPRAWRAGGAAARVSPCT